MKRRTKHIITGLLLTLFSGAAHGMLIMPTQDATVHALNPDTNYGSDMQLRAERHGSSPNFTWSKAYVQFESPTFTVTDIEKIEAFALATSYPRQANVWLITSEVDVAWNGSTITYNNAPFNDVTGHALEANAAVRIGNLDQPAQSTNQTVGIVFSETGKADLIDAMNNYSHFTLVISRPTDRSVAFASLEDLTEGRHPLQITVIPEPATSALILGAGVIGLLMIRRPRLKK
jgi:hypothetical protein